MKVKSAKIKLLMLKARNNSCI